jgi:hypothetical protein
LLRRSRWIAKGIPPASAPPTSIQFKNSIARID